MLTIDDFECNLVTKHFCLKQHLVSTGQFDRPLSCVFFSGETGLLVGMVTQRSPFVGYAGNEQQTEKKRLRDVMKKGDLYFNTGDLLRVDDMNFVYFQDRVGDTFRQAVIHLLH